MNITPQHQYQVLTKRSERLVELAPQLTWTDNIWIGVSIENNDVINRIDDIRNIPAHIRFLSIEPLIGPIPDLDLTGINWVIVGGESGPSSRPLNIDWVRPIRTKY